jgi:hypothetical protein
MKQVLYTLANCIRDTGSQLAPSADAGIHSQLRGTLQQMCHPGLTLQHAAQLSSSCAVCQWPQAPTSHVHRYVSCAGGPVLHTSALYVFGAGRQRGRLVGLVRTELLDDC